MRLRVGAATSAGRVREINEDVYLVRTSAGLFVVCDGMGGGPAGEVASQIAAATIAEHLEGPPPAESPGEGRFRPQTNRLAAAVRQSNQVIYAEGQRDPRRAEMGSTVVGALVAEQIASVAHVGDSRAYLWRDERLEPLTRDHSLAETLAAEGLSGGAASLPPGDESLLVRVLGGESDVDVDVKEVPLLRGDFLVLCSDGLTRMVSESVLRDTISRIRDPQRICDFLVEEANRRGGADNITVVVVAVAERWWRELADRWRRDAAGAHDAEADPEV